jgi:predicted nucleic acid-binding protein
MQGRWYLTLLNDLLPRGIVILDASVLINLLGCGEPVAVLTGLGEKCLMEQRTLNEVRKHPIPGVDLNAPLSDLFAAGTLEEVRMTDNEYETYLTFVSGLLGTRLDDGESAALAISGRGSSIVLDERKARRRAGECARAVAVASTLQLMVTSGHRQAWSVQRVRHLVAAARAHSRMGVPKEDSALLEQLLRS